MSEYGLNEACNKDEKGRSFIDNLLIYILWHKLLNNLHAQKDFRNFFLRQGVDCQKYFLGVGGPPSPLFPCPHMAKAYSMFKSHSKRFFWYILCENWDMILSAMFIQTLFLACFEVTWTLTNFYPKAATPTEAMVASVLQNSLV